MKHLEEIGLIKKNDKLKRYDIEVLAPNVAMLVPYNTLKILVDTLNENTISAYVYWLSRYIANNEKPFEFSLASVKSHIGICATTRSNNDIITNILFILEKIGLIKYHLDTLECDEFGNVKTIYMIDWMTNELK